MKEVITASIPKTKRTIPVAGRDHIQGPINAPIKLPNAREGVAKRREA